MVSSDFMKITIGVMGSSLADRPENIDAAVAIGKMIAERKAVLITGATTGLPFHAARGAKLSGGEVIGFSPAINMEEHQKMGLPVEFHDLIICTGLTFKGRNLLNIRASQALLFIGGSMGTLNEFTIAYDEEKVMGILEGSGGFCDHMQNWIRHLAKPGNRAVIHYNNQVSTLVDSVFHSIPLTK
jgi:uncharacterized protein (TIGR00725 family)